MPEFKEVTEKLDIPKNTGIEGFMLTMRKIISLPKIQSIVINANGRITFTRIVREGDEVRPLEVDLESVTPAGIVRNSDVVEIETDESPSRAVARLLEKTAQEHLFPIALVSGPGSTFWDWHAYEGLYLSAARDEAYGLPFLYDEYFPPSTLVLCAGYTRGSTMVDVKKCFKLMMPEAHNLLRRS